MLVLACHAKYECKKTIEEQATANYLAYVNFDQLLWPSSGLSDGTEKFGVSNSRWPRARKMATPRGWSVGVAKAGLKATDFDHILSGGYHEPRGPWHLKINKGLSL